MRQYSFCSIKTLSVTLAATAMTFLLPQTTVASDAMLAKKSCSATNECISPVGNWLTIDDKTNKPRGVVHIFEKKDAEGNVTLMGSSKFGFYTPNLDWSKTYTGSYAPFKGKKFGSFPIMWNYQDHGHGHWADGKIFDSDHNKLYSSKLDLQDNGNDLKVSGCIAFICRGQVWHRLDDAQYDYYKQLSLQDIKDHPQGP